MLGNDPVERVADLIAWSEAFQHRLRRDIGEEYPTGHATLISADSLTSAS